MKNISQFPQNILITINSTDDCENNAQSVQYDSEDEEITVAQTQHNAKKKKEAQSS